MNSQVFPLTVHNNTNGQLSCKYMQQTQLGSSVIKIAPRGQAVIPDAYMGMSVYATNEYNATQAYAYVNVNQNVDDIFFSESAGGLGRGSPVGPPDTSSRDLAGDRSRERIAGINERIAAQQRAAAAEAEAVAAAVPASGDSADQHGTSLAAAYGGGAQADGGGGGGDGKQQMVYVPNMGYMPRESVPPQLLAQLEARAQAMGQGMPAQQQQQQQQRPQRQPFMSYDQQAIAASLDGVKPLPPVNLVARHKPSYFGELSAPEQWFAGMLSNYGGMTRVRADYFARPLLLALLALAFYAYIVSSRKRHSVARAIPPPSMRRYRPQQQRYY